MITDPTVVTNNWKNAMAQAGTKYSAAIDRVTDNPMAKAAANVQGYLAGVNANAQKWVARLQASDFNQWKQAAKQKGAAALPAAAALAAPKYQAFIQQFLPVLANNVQQVRAMPNLTFQDKINRMVQMATLNHGFKRT